MNDTFLMLGIESSCDETAAALVKSDGTNLAMAVQQSLLWVKELLISPPSWNWKTTRIM